MQIHLDAVGGVAGDMVAAALLDAFPEHEAGVRESVARASRGRTTCALLAHGDGVLQGRRFAVTGPEGEAPDRVVDDHGHHHHHDHAHDHGLVHSHDGGKPHSHATPESFSWRGVVAMGAAAGLIPCPSALVVLLGAVAQGQIGLGMVLIVAFSVGLAATLTFLGLAVVYAGKALSRAPIPGRLTVALPTVSALLIVAVGVVLTVQAVPQVA